MQKAFYYCFLISLSVISCTTPGPNPEPEKDPTANYLKGKAITGGGNNFLVLLEDETIKTLGITMGSGEDLTQIIDISSGFNHSLALRRDGTLWAWGENSFGQVGDSTNIHRKIPKQIYGMTNVIAISAGFTHSLALKADGTVWAWGGNIAGQLGDNSTESKNYPVMILSDVKYISAGSIHSLVIKTDGTVWGWGYNNEGNLGATAATSQKKPIRVEGLYNIVAICGGDNYTVALKNDSTLWAMGINDKGQLGIGSTSANITTPSQITGISKIIAISTGRNYSLAIQKDSTVWGWGNNSSGNIGDGTTIQRNVPVMVQHIKNIKSISSSWGGHSAAIEDDGIVWTWGNNTTSQLGESLLNLSVRYSPDRVKE